ncbi:malate dehydrogenase (quinone) [Millisia brevis]|uniref:malate dehydrogenase (quinone) n=1 Tax=Millisia brevis TaxID=264148 RepID=UPI0012EEB856
METVDVVLVGAGIMSATLGALLRKLEPSWTVRVYERLDAAAAESSDAWNNAGTGHSALCELNYTPQQKDGTVDVNKAITVNEQFQLSRQFWATSVATGMLGDPKDFISPVPHVSFVTGTANSKYLRARYDALAPNPLFAGMEFIDDPTVFAERLPLMARGRDAAQPIALNWSDRGTDVDFGSLTRQLLNYVAGSGSAVHFGHEVQGLSKDGAKWWEVKVRNRRSRESTTVRARFVFVGAGGGALRLLQKSGIPEAKGFGGFPVSGEWLRCINPSAIAEHDAKVYGKAAVGAPPMSVPHLDTRVIGGKRDLLFGPFAGWTPKFLKNGRNTDLFASVRPNNIGSMLGVGLTELGLVKYLVGELAKGPAARVDELREFYPRAADPDWYSVVAGQRVQVIRRKGRGGVLEFGTAVITAGDGSIAGLLGASPGASTAVSAMLTVLERCFGDRWTQWRPVLEEMVPSLGTSLAEQPRLFEELWDYSTRELQLDRSVRTDPADTGIAAG